MFCTNHYIRFCSKSANVDDKLCHVNAFVGFPFIVGLVFRSTVEEKVKNDGKTNHDSFYNFLELTQSAGISFYYMYSKVIKYMHILK